MDNNNLTENLKCEFSKLLQASCNGELGRIRERYVWCLRILDMFYDTEIVKTHEEYREYREQIKKIYEDDIKLNIY